MERVRGGGSAGGSSSRGPAPEPCSVHSARGHLGRTSGNSNPRSGASPAVRRHWQQQQHPQAKFDIYMPLCELQQGLKRGEIIEGILRVNPRNYEDSYISAPDGQMDIYIRGICDRNRALNGDHVAIKLKPPHDWKILWDVIGDYEDRHGKSIFSNDSHFSNGFNASAAWAPSSGALPGGPGPSQGWASGWLVSDSQRSADSLEILGLDQLQQQFQEFTKENAKKKKKTRNRSKKNRQLHDKDAQHNISQTLTDTDSALHVSSPGCQPDPNSNSASSLHSLEQPPVVESQLTVVHSNSKHSSLEPSTQDNKVCLSSMENCNSNVENVNFGAPCQPSLTGSQSSFNKNETAEDSIVSSSEEELFPKSSAVAPDELSGDEFSNSASGDSVGSQQLVQDLEDEEFFAEHQDACNNNEPSENFPVDLILDEQLDPALEIQNLIDQAKQLSVNQEMEPKTSAGSGDIQQECSEQHSADTTENNTSVQVSVELTENIASVQVSAEPTENITSAQVSAESTENIASVQVSAELTENMAPVQISTTAMSVVAESTEHEVSLEKDAAGKGKRRARHRNRKHKKQEKEEDGRGTVLSQTPVSRPKAMEANQGIPSKLTMHARKNNSGKMDTPYPNVTVADILQLPDHQKFVQKTGKVVYIIERKHSRAAMGYLKKQQDNSPYWAMFSPIDHRMPRMIIPMAECPKDFYERPEDFKTSLFIAMIKEWDERSTFARGSLARSLGEAGEIEPETEGILIEHDVDFSEFSEDCLKDLPSLPWQIPQEEVDRRRDFRSHCVFTIDPKTARDLDDAISVCEIEDGLLEVGVHIADVSFFLKENTPLDLVASRRSTSVYLVQKVVPMLPRVLCEQLCSLNPGEDKLTFSVVWKMTPEGNIVDEWFGRTIIHSCTKFSYEHAQDMIEKGDCEWQPEELPSFHGPFGPKDVLWCVGKLQTLALNLRKKRFHEGALKLDQIKIQFSLNPETGMPDGFSIYEQKDSNRLIEELMLLANMAVAHKIYRSFPNKAFLRCHPPPQSKMMNDVVETSATLGIHLDPSSAGNLQASLARYCGDDVLSEARNLVLTHLCSKPMKPARYFCAGWTSDREDFHHYALNVPLYTHFTSPIRRYPDVIVHRLLAAALGLGPEPSQTALALQKQAVHCNDKKMAAKRAHEMSCELFLGCFIREVGPLEESGVVVDVMDHSFDVLIQRMGVIKRVYCDKLGVSSVSYEKQMGVARLTLTWPREGGQPQTQQIMMFTLVQVVISSIPKETMKFNVIIKPPKVQPVS